MTELIVSGSRFTSLFLILKNHRLWAWTCIGKALPGRCGAEVGFEARPGPGGLVSLGKVAASVSRLLSPVTRTDFGHVLKEQFVPDI